MSRLFTIFDIHGEADLLFDLLDQLDLHYKIDYTKDKLIFTGDYVDRGSNSKLVIQTLKDLQEKHPGNVICLRGNHEDMAIMACTTKRWDQVQLWNMNGGAATQESYGWTNKWNPYMDPDHIKWMASLPTSHEEPGFFFSHAPVPKEELRRKPGTPYDDHELTWTYFPFVDESEFAAKLKDKVGVCGHIHRLREGYNVQPRFYDHYIYGDTGAGCHGKAPLTCIEVVSREHIQAWPPEKETK
jgi:serine/threonine protein phosphatase 1